VILQFLDLVLAHIIVLTSNIIKYDKARYPMVVLQTGTVKRGLMLILCVLSLVILSLVSVQYQHAQKDRLEMVFVMLCSLVKTHMS